MKKALRIFGIIMAVVIAIPCILIGYSYATRGIIPAYTREELGIYMPYFYADDYEINSSPTDSSSYYCFELNESEINKIREDIKNNSAWFRYAGDSDDIFSLNPAFGPFMKGQDVNFDNCYVALFDFSDDCFVYDTEGLVNCGCAIYDKENEKLYYLEMIW